MSSSPTIDRAIVDAILAGRLRPGMRLGEQALADLFEVSRTSVREALIRLEARGLVRVSARRGWFVVAPSVEEAREIFQARRAIERGILLDTRQVPADAVAMLREHVARERQAIAENDVEAQSELLGDFHVCLVEALGNRVLAELLRDLTARTVLISALHRSEHDACDGCSEHEAITDFLAAGDLAGAAALMTEHLGHVEASLTLRSEPDRLFDLRLALQPSGFKSGSGEPR